MSDNARIQKLEDKITKVMARPAYSSSPAWKQEVAEARLQIEGIRAGKNVARTLYERPTVKTGSGGAAAVEAEATADVTSDHHHDDHSIRPYMVIFVWLIVLTALEVGIGNVVGGIKLWIALTGMAVAKALFVALYYMHLQTEQKAVKGLLLLPVVLVFVLFMLIVPDAVNFLENYW